MNRHFEDARYYLTRAGKKAKQGVAEELEPVEEKFKALTGDDEAPELGRLDNIREELEGIEERAEGEAKEAVTKARERIRSYREGEDAAPSESKA